jgi:hypothetical protein
VFGIPHATLHAAANDANNRSRLSVTYNTQYANTLHAGKGLEWFWFTDTQDNVNTRPNDVRN